MLDITKKWTAHVRGNFGSGDVKMQHELIHVNGLRWNRGNGTMYEDASDEMGVLSIISARVARRERWIVGLCCWTKFG
jgi:hypothetical protein